MARLLFIHHSGIIGGAGLSLNNVMSAVRDGNELFVLVSTEPDDMLKKFRSDGLIHVIPYGRRIGAVTYYSGGDRLLSPRLLYRTIMIFKQRKYFNRRIQTVDPDVVIVNSMTTSWISKLPEARKRRSICFVRETFKGNRNSMINRYIRGCLERFSRVVFLSGYDRTSASLRHAPAEVICNYVSDDQFSLSMTKRQACDRLGVPEDAFLLLYAGGVSSIKGFDIAVRAVLSSDKNIRLIVAGNDFESAAQTKDRKERKYIRSWENYIRQNDKHNRIIFVGRQSDMSSCYACSDAVIVPMREPHQSRPVFEAGCFHKPVIITNFENIREYVKDGFNGLSAKNEDVDEFREKIGMLVDDEELKRRLGENNYHCFKENHSREAVTKKLNAILKEVLKP